jgi:DNA-binding transcriptional LysR family regulator
MLEPSRLLTFREVARQQSFSRAGGALALTQPAVSQRVRALERQLGEQLIDRTARAFTLTAAGELLLEHADAVWQRLSLAEAQLGELVANRRHRLTIGAFPSALATLVPAAMASARASYPDIEISVTEGVTDELADAVRSGRLHIALCFQDAGAERREHPGITRHDLLEEPMVALLAPDHRFAYRREVSLSGLAEETWTAPSRDGLIRRACVDAGFEPRIAYLSRDPLAIRALVAGGFAVTLTPRLLASQLHGTCARSIRGHPARRQLYALTPLGAPHPVIPGFLAALRL